MLRTHLIRDTYEALNIVDIKEDCIVTPTHLTAVISLTGTNLFEKKKEDAISYILWMSQIIKELGFPIQMIAQNRVKDLSRHVAHINKTFKQNDFKIKIPKTLERFKLYYKKDLEDGNITQEQIQQKFEESPEFIEKTMVESYRDRLDSVIWEHNLRDKKYYFVLSTLDTPKTIHEKDEMKYPTKNWSEDIFEEEKQKLEERVKKTLGQLNEYSWMWSWRLDTIALENLLFENYNYPQKHKINPLTEYGKIPPLLRNNSPKEAIEKDGWMLSFTEGVINFGIEMVRENTQSIKSNDVLQKIKPFSIDDSHMEYLKINDQYLYTIHIHRFWDEDLEDLMLWPILSLEHIFDLNIHIIPKDKELVLQEVLKKQRTIEVDFQERKRKLSRNQAEYELHNSQKEMDKLTSFASELRNKSTWIYSPSIDITFRASSLDELEMIKQEVSQKLSDKKIFFSEATGNHYNGFISTSPLLINKIAGYNLPFERFPKTLEEISHYYPYCPDSITNYSGVMLGLWKQTNNGDTITNVEFFDYFDRNRIINSIWMVIWNSGSGKTTMAHGMFKTQELLGYKHYILDYLGNYITWAKDMPDRYQIIKIDSTSEDKINPCDIYIPNNEFLSKSEKYSGKTSDEIKEIMISEKVDELSNYFRMFFGESYNDVTEGIMDEITKQVYIRKMKNFDIFHEKEFQDIILQDIVDNIQNSNHKNKELLENMTSILSKYSSWSLKWMFWSKTNIKVDSNKSIVFYLRGNKSDRSSELATMLSFLIVKWLSYKNRWCILAIDELAKIFRMETNIQIQNHFRANIAEIRNQDWGVVGMTQLMKQVMGTPAGREFFEISQWKLYLAWWNNDGLENLDIKKYDSNLSESSLRYLVSNNRPWYWVLKVWPEQIHLTIANHPDLSLYERYKVPKEN